MQKIYLLLILCSQCLFGQTEPEFKSVKERFSKIYDLLDQDMRKLYPQAQNTKEKEALVAQYEHYKSQIDSAQNAENTFALVSYKTRKNVENFVFKKPEAKLNLPENNKIGEEEANYPGGIQKLREELSEKVYSDNLSIFGDQLEAVISFVVNPNGEVWVELVEGRNLLFNRQAEIAVYCLEQRFSPAKLDGRSVHSRFKLPLKIVFN